MFIFMNSRVILTTTVRLSPSFIFPIFGSRSAHDHDVVNNVPIETPKTGFERVKKMFRKTIYGLCVQRLQSETDLCLNTAEFCSETDEISIELNNVLQMSFSGAFFGACMGGVIKSRKAYVDFLENNQATIFKSTYDAKKKLQDYVTVAFAKGSYYWGWRLGIFSGIFGLITTIISVYRNDSSIVEYVTAGAITGAIYKANLGPVAMMVGAGLGAVLSFFGGLLILTILKTTGKSMDDIRASLFKIRQGREEQFDQVLEKAATEKHDSLTRHHDHIVQEKGIAQLHELK